MTSLPPKVPQRLQDVAHALSAYDICLRLEKSLQLAANKGDDVGNNLIFIRILGYLIHYAPTDQGLKTVVEEISSCADDSALLLVGKMYYDHYIRAFRANRGRIPTPSNYPSRPSFDTIIDMINDTLVDAPQSHSDAKKNALIRDGYCCVVTGRFDTRSVMDNRELKERVRSDSSLATEGTECAHIIAGSTNVDIGPGTAKRNYAATMWAVMRRFGHDELPDDLNGSKVHRLENVMTLAQSFHTFFDSLQVWFVATNEKNKYKLEATEAFLLRNCKEYVTFTTPNEAKLPVPSPIYLGLHAACAKVAHLSGAAECIDKFYQDMDDSTTLDADGGSAAMLEHAIFELQARGYETTV